MPRGKTYDNVNGTIGDTPLIRINRLIPEGHATVYAKAEFFQPLNSVTGTKVAVRKVNGKNRKVAP